MSDRASRYNNGKPRYDLIPPDALRTVAWVYTVGAEKYDAHNWLKGMPWSEVIASAERHLAAIKAGEDIDADTGLPHGALLAWNGLCLTTYLLRSLGTDDRVSIVGDGETPLFDAIDAMGRRGLEKYGAPTSPPVPFGLPRARPAAPPLSVPPAVDLDKLERELRAGIVPPVQS